MSLFGSQIQVENTETYSYTKEDARWITANIEGTCDFLTIPTQEVNTKDLIKLQKKETALELHAITLFEYYLAKRIPRGLRYNLRPTLFANDREYCNQLDFFKIRHHSI